MQVTVRDENDNAPRFSRSRYYTTIRENGTAGAVITQLTVTDADVGPNAQVVYRVAGAHRDQFTILDNGTMIATVPLDREVSMCVCVFEGWGLFGWPDGKLRDASRLVKAEWGGGCIIACTVLQTCPCVLLYRCPRSCCSPGVTCVFVYRCRRSWW